MQPTIAFHGIASLELSAIRTGKTDSGAYAVRDLTLTDRDGKRFEVRLFSDGDANALAVHDLNFAEEPKCALPEPAAPKHDALAFAPASRLVRLPKDVRGDGPFFQHIVAPAGVYQARTNRLGAVSVLTPNGEELGVKPGEFEWFDPPKSEQWTPPANPRPHTFPPAGGICTRCDATPHGALSRLACCTGKPSRLTDAERGEAADAAGRA